MRAERDLSRVTPTTKLRLDEAAALAFPDGSVVKSTLRREMARGHLTVWRIGNRHMTTLEEIEKMVERCRVQPSLPDSGFALPAEPANRSGSFSTQGNSTALAAARMRAERLKNGSPNTSEASMTPSPSFATAQSARG